MNYLAELAAIHENTKTLTPAETAKVYEMLMQLNTDGLTRSAAIEVPHISYVVEVVPGVDTAYLSGKEDWGNALVIYRWVDGNPMLLDFLWCHQDYTMHNAKAGGKV